MRRLIFMLCAVRWVRVIGMQGVGLVSVLAVGFAVAGSGEGHERGHGASLTTGTTNAHAVDDGETWTRAAARTPSVGERQTDTGNAGGSQAAHTHDALATAEPIMDDVTSYAMADAGTVAATTHLRSRPEPNAEELVCLSDLTAQAKELTARLTNYDAAVAEGYRFPAKEGGTHHPNQAYHRDGSVFDLTLPESAIYRTRDDGSKVLIGVLYHAPVGSGPTPCGNATWWHTHATCVNPDTRARLDAGPEGACPEGTLVREGRMEMLHLWFVPRHGLN